MPTGYIKIKDFKGVNLTDPPSMIADNELAWARNCFGDDKGQINPRVVQTAISAGLLTGNITVLGDYLADLGVYGFIDKELKQRLIFWVPGNVDSLFLLGNASGFGLSGAGAGIISWPFTTGALPFGGAGSPKRPGSLVFNNELYLFPGHTVPGLIFGADDAVSAKAGNAPQFRELGAQGTGWTTGSGTTGDRFKFTFGEVFRNVFLLGGLPPPFESLVAFTDAGNTPGALLSTAKWAGVGFGDGDRLLRCITTPIIGGAAAVEPYAMAFKQRSVWLLQGTPPSSTDNGTLTVTPVMRREGLVSPDAVCNTPYGIVWCSGRNVWLMPPGTQPRSIGDKIKGFLDSLPQQPSSLWFMEFHDDVLYLNFPSPQGITTGKGFGGTGATRTYLASQQLWCDMRNPDEPKWWGPQDVRASHMKSLFLVDGSRQVSGVTAWDEGGGNVRVQPFTLNGGMNFDHATTTGQTVRGDIDLGDPGTLAGVDIDTPPVSVAQDVRTREFDFGDDSLTKLLDAVEVNSWWDLALGVQPNPGSSGDIPFLFIVLANGARRASLTTTGAATGSQVASSPDQTGFALDRNRLDGANSAPLLSETYIPATFFPSSGSRFLGRSYQFIVEAMQVSSANPSTSADQLFTRKFKIRSFTPRIRPFGRRPGGTYGG